MNTEPDSVEKLAADCRALAANHDASSQEPIMDLDDVVVAANHGMVRDEFKWIADRLDAIVQAPASCVLVPRKLPPLLGAAVSISWPLSQEMIDELWCQLLLAVETGAYTSESSK